MMTDNQMHNAIDKALEDLRQTQNSHWGKIEIEIGTNGQVKYVNLLKTFES